MTHGRSGAGYVDRSLVTWGLVALGVAAVFALVFVVLVLSDPPAVLPFGAALIAGVGVVIGGVLLWMSRN